jgi:hypothetical protein
LEDNVDTTGLEKNIRENKKIFNENWSRSLDVKTAQASLIMFKIIR